MDMKAKILTVLALAGVCSLSSATFATSSPSQGPSGLVGHSITRVETVMYEPGTARRWPAEGGIHQVTVVSGTVSIDVADERRLYEAGDTFVAGWETYTATNPTVNRAQVRVTYLRSAT